MKDMKILRAKEALFKMIRQYCLPTKLFDESDELYIYNYCEGALESAFNVLGIEGNYITLIDFCKMWEDNSRAIWLINLPDRPFTGVTADIHYNVFKESYENHQKWLEEDCE